MNHDLSLVLRKAGCSKVFSLIYDFFSLFFFAFLFFIFFSFFFVNGFPVGNEKQFICR